MSTITLKAQSPASVTQPESGSNEQKLFLDSTNSNILSTKDETGTVTPSGVGTATELATTGSSVLVNTAGQPTAGQALIADDPTTATWQDLPAGAMSVSTGGSGAGGAYNNADSPVSATVEVIHRVDVSGGNVTVNLPSGHSAGDRIAVKLVTTATPSTNECVVDGDAAETIDGAATETLDTDYEWINLVSDGTNWMQLG